MYRYTKSMLKIQALYKVLSALRVFDFQSCHGNRFNLETFRSLLYRGTAPFKFVLVYDCRVRDDLAHLSLLIRSTLRQDCSALSHIPRCGLPGLVPTPYRALRPPTSTSWDTITRATPEAGEALRRWKGVGR